MCMCSLKILILVCCKTSHYTFIFALEAYFPLIEKVCVLEDLSNFNKVSNTIQKKPT